MGRGIFHSIADTWRAQGPIEVLRRAGARVRFALRRALALVIPRRAIADYRRAFSAGGVRGLGIRLRHQWRVLFAYSRRGHQSEDELAATTMEYWNNGDKVGVDLGDFSHWEGAGPWRDRSRWLALGQIHFEMYEAMCRHSGATRPARRVVEWGSGGGANAIHFIHEAEEFCGVEIAQASLDECERVLSAAGFRGFRPVLIQAAQPEEAERLAGQDFDLFLSTYVFELLPGRRYGERVARVAYEMLRPGGLALIQIRYDDGTDRSSQKNSNYFRNACRFTSYRVEDFWVLMQEIGFRPLYVELIPEARPGFAGDLYAYFALEKPTESVTTT